MTCQTTRRKQISRGNKVRFTRTPTPSRRTSRSVHEYQNPYTNIKKRTRFAIVAEAYFGNPLAFPLSVPNSRAIKRDVERATTTCGCATRPRHIVLPGASPVGG